MLKGHLPMWGLGSPGMIFIARLTRVGGWAVGGEGRGFFITDFRKKYVMHFNIEKSF